MTNQLNKNHVLGTIQDKNALPSLPNAPGQNTAAGALQITAQSYRSYAQHVGVSDQQNVSQLLVGVQMLVELGAITPLLNGNFTGAIAAAAGPLGNQWAALPGGIMPRIDLATATQYYHSHGGF